VVGRFHGAHRLHLTFVILRHVVCRDATRQAQQHAHSGFRDRRREGASVVGAHGGMIAKGRIHTVDSRGAPLDPLEPGREVEVGSANLAVHDLSFGEQGAVLVTILGDSDFDSCVHGRFLDGADFMRLEGVHGRDADGTGVVGRGWGFGFVGHSACCITSRREYESSAASNVAKGGGGVRGTIVSGVS
jgi:hypothetical protein